jgi:hypothetical protein
MTMEEHFICHLWVEFLQRAVGAQSKGETWTLPHFAA